MNCDKDPNKLGKFEVSGELLRRWRSTLELMRAFVIVDARWQWDKNAVIFTAYSDLFAELAEGVDAPMYRIILNTENDRDPKLTIKAERLP